MKYKMSGVIVHTYVDKLCCDKQTNIEIFANSKQSLLEKKNKTILIFEWGQPGYDNVQIEWDNSIWINEAEK